MAIKEQREKYNNDSSFWNDEVMNSAKELFNQCTGIKLVDCSIGSYSHSYISVKFTNNDEAGYLQGKRAFAWFENNLFHDLRVAYIGAKRKELRQYGSSYYAGNIKPCPFTGLYFDDVLIDAIKKGCKEGNTVKDILEGLADVLREEFESNEEQENSEEYITEYLVNNDIDFLENGQRI